jgi:putative oxidoreductase
MLGRLLKAKFIPSNVDAGLLLLRIGTGLILFLRHGWEKVSRMTLVNPKMPSMYGLGHNTSWVLALLSDGVLSLVLIFGLGTRWIALFQFCSIFTAWAFVHHFIFLGRDPSADHGELICLYLSSLLALIVAGAGRYSVDAALDKEPETSHE